MARIGRARPAKPLIQKKVFVAPSRLFFSGFEVDAAPIHSYFDFSAVANGFELTYGRYGGYGFFPGSTTNVLSGTALYCGTTFVSPNSLGCYYFRAYIKRVTSPSGSSRIVQIENSTPTALIIVTMTTSGTLQLSDEDGDIGSASGALTANQWYRLEIKVDLRAAAGAHVISARLDGTDFAASSTRNISSGVTRFKVGSNLAGEAVGTGTWYFDDIAINTQSSSPDDAINYPGSGTIVTLLPSGAGDSNQFLKSGGGAADTSNYADVDEATPDGATSYLKSNTTGHTDFYAVTNPSFSSSAPIKCVAVGAQLAGDNSSANGTIRVKAKKTTGGTVANGVTQSPTNTTFFANAVSVPRIQQLVMSRDPDGGAWTSTTLGTLQIGVECVASNTNGVRVSQVVAYVEYDPVSNDFSSALSETITIVDALIKTQSKVLADVVTIVDTVAKTSGKVLAEVVTIVDSILRTPEKVLSEVVTIVDTVERILSRLLAEVITIVDTAESLRVVPLTLANEVITVVDDITVKITAKLLEEVVTVVDTVTRTSEKALSEVITIVDTVTRVLGKIFSEAVEIVDSFVNGLAYTRTFSEVVTVVDDFLTRSEFHKTLTDVVTIVDTFGREMGKFFSDPVVIVDTVNRAVSRALSEVITIVDVTVEFFKRARGFIRGVGKRTNTGVGAANNPPRGQSKNTNTQGGTRL